jgi:hypothetical protein
VESVDHLYSVRIETLRKGVIHQKEGNVQELRIPRMLNSVLLERSQVIRIPQLGPQLLKDVPVALLRLDAKCLRDVLAEILLDAVVVEQGIVHIQEKHNVGLIGHVTHVRECPPVARSAASSTAGVGPRALCRPAA